MWQIELLSSTEQVIYSVWCWLTLPTLTRRLQNLAQIQLDKKSHVKETKRRGNIIIFIFLADSSALKKMNLFQWLNAE